MQEFVIKMQKINAFLDKGVFEIVGNEAVSHYRKNFRDEGFTDKTTTKWKDVQRRTNPRDKKKAAANSPILTGSGELGNSIRWRRGAGRIIIISSDKVYAAVHNEGLRAGRGTGFRMPKRQFIGPSVTLNRNIKNKIAAHIMAIVKS